MFNEIVCNGTHLLEVGARSEDLVHEILNREDVVLPLSSPIRGRDGKMITEIPIPKDTTILVGVMSSNTSKALWGEDAYEWKPERWLSPLPETITEAKIWRVL